MRQPPPLGTPFCGCPTFDAQFALAGADFEVTAFESPLPGFGLDALQGRDVLADCVLVYDGAANTFSLKNALT
jgi:hypothetical protein